MGAHQWFLSCSSFDYSTTANSLSQLRIARKYTDCVKESVCEKSDIIKISHRNGG